MSAVQNSDWLEKLLTNKPIFLISVSLLVVLAGLNLIGTNALATQGVAVNDLETKTLSLEKENHELQVKVEETANLQIMSQLAHSQGFGQASDIVFMPTPPATAMR